MRACGTHDGLPTAPKQLRGHHTADCKPRNCVTYQLVPGMALAADNQGPSPQHSSRGGSAKNTKHHLPDRKQSYIQVVLFHTFCISARCMHLPMTT